MLKQCNCDLILKMLIPGTIRHIVKRIILYNYISSANGTKFGSESSDLLTEEIYSFLKFMKAL